MQGEGGGTPSSTPDHEPPATPSSSTTTASDDVAAFRVAHVDRAGLVDRLVAATEPVVAVVAPPGYGKSTLLTQWAARRGRRVAWVECDRIRDDAASLCRAVESALAEGEPTDSPARDVGAGDVDRPLDRVVELLGSQTRPVAVVLDQVEALSSRECREGVVTMAAAVPAGSQLVLATRAELQIGQARLRVEHRLLEIGATDLAMTPAEASQLLRTAGVELSGEETRGLVSDTEGWPAALYLAALALRSGEMAPDGVFRGTDRAMSDYLRSEVLDRLAPSQREFLVRTSILARVSGPLADAVVGGAGSAGLLEQLVRENRLVMPLDHEGEWYRYHPLLQGLLRAELRRETPELLPRLHARASAWFEADGLPEDAIDHAHLAGDAERFGRLVLEVMQQVWASGRIDTVESWMGRLGKRSPEPQTPAMIAHGALIFALLGRAGDAERWAAVAESLPVTGTLSDGSTVEGTLAYLRANLARNGPAAMRADSWEALGGLGPASPYRSTMVHTLGLADLLEGDLDAADASFAHAYDLATSIEASPLAAVVLSEQFLIAADNQEWAAADSLVKRAVDIVARGPYDDYWTSALPLAAAARAAAHRGDMGEARAQARRASRLRPLLTYALPVVSLQALVELARAYLALVDPAGARAVIEQARGILQQRPDLGTLANTVASLDERISQITAATPIGASSLTAAELRLVPLLSTHLTYPEIGERLFISRHTVKTQAGSVYRKLGVTSRRAAVDRIVELGLA